MKKILTGLILATILFAPVIASATILDSCTINYDLSEHMGAKGMCTLAGQPTGKSCAINSDTCEDGVCCVLNLITKVQKWFFAGVMILSVIFLVIGAFYFVTAAGSPDRVSTAKTYIIYAVIGFAVAILAQGILNFTKGLVG